MKQLLFGTLALLLFGCGQSPEISSHCEANARCLLAPGIEISLSQSRPEPETPFVITLTGNNISPPQTAYLEGVNMYMGKIPVFFTETKSGLAAEAMVGVCSSKKMQWQLVIEWQAQTLRYPIETIAN